MNFIEENSSDGENAMEMWSEVVRGATAIGCFFAVAFAWALFVDWTKRREEKAIVDWAVKRAIKRLQKERPELFKRLA